MVMTEQEASVDLWRRANFPNRWRVLGARARTVSLLRKRLTSPASDWAVS